MRSARVKDLRAAIAWLSTYPVGKALPEVDPEMGVRDYSRQAVAHAREGYPESESISLAMMHLTKEIERREAEARRRADQRFRYRGQV